MLFLKACHPTAYQCFRSSVCVKMAQTGKNNAVDRFLHIFSHVYIFSDSVQLNHNPQITAVKIVLENDANKATLK